MQHPPGNPKRAPEPAGLLLEAEVRSRPLRSTRLRAFRIDPGEPVLPGSGAISRGKRMADPLTMLVFPVHARARVIDMLPGAAAQPAFHHGLLFLAKLFLCTTEQLGDRTGGNHAAPTRYRCRCVTLAPLRLPSPCTSHRAELPPGLTAALPPGRSQCGPACCAWCAV